jgi:flagellar protein FlbD
MIKLTKFTGDEFFLNPESIKSVEAGGDTIVTLITGERMLVRESAKDICTMFLNYKKEINNANLLIS